MMNLNGIPLLGYEAERFMFGVLFMTQILEVVEKYNQPFAVVREAFWENNLPEEAKSGIAALVRDIAKMPKRFPQIAGFITVESRDLYGEEADIEEARSYLAHAQTVGALSTEARPA